MRTLPAAVSLAAMIVGSAALAYDPIVLARGWYQVDVFENGDCAGEVGSNGRFYLISAGGFAPGARAILTITNGDMPPLRREIRADGAGQWQDYYVPFRYNRGEGELVTVKLAGESCVVPLEFAWSRAKGWDGTAPLALR